MKNILLPTDFSKNSLNAIKYAVKLFQHSRCNFYILNIQKITSFISDDMMAVSSSATIYNTLIDTAKKSNSNIISKLEKKYKNDKHMFHSIVDYENFVDSIKQNCESNNIDLIVMGTKGASGLEKVFFGTNTVHVIQKADVPVLVIPDGYKFKELDSIAFTSSMKTMYNKRDFKPIFDIIGERNSKLRVLHVERKEKNEIDLIDNREFFTANFDEVQYDTINSKDKDIYECVHNYILSNKIKMICMLNKKHTILDRLFSRYAAEEFAFKIDIPLLVCNSF